LNCQKVLELIHSYVDRELDAVQTSEVERHLEQCEACDLIYRTQIALRSALHDPSLYHRAPPALKGRIRSSLQKEAKGSQSSHTATSSGLISW
jgi:Predicted transmembrane transcriptional regulator (anti-sigma factor)